MIVILRSRPRGALVKVLVLYSQWKNEETITHFYVNIIVTEGSKWLRVWVGVIYIYIYIYREREREKKIKAGGRLLGLTRIFWTHIEIYISSCFSTPNERWGSPLGAHLRAGCSPNLTVCSVRIETVGPWPRISCH